MSILSAGELSLHYEFDASPKRPVLVLSNSLGTDLSMWSPQVACFTQHFSLLRYDTRGHGGSSAPPHFYTIEQLSRDVIKLLDALSLDRVHFCGLSMGGMIGQWLGAHAPERLHSLVLADTAAQCGEADPWNGRIKNALESGMEAVLPDMLGGWFTEAFSADHPEEVARIHAMFRATKPEGFAACCAAIRDMDQRDSAVSIQVPTLIVCGIEDVATPPSDSRFLHKNIAGSEKLMLSSGHLSNIEDADAFTAGVLNFLLRH